MYTPGDQFKVDFAIPGTTVGNVYQVLSKYRQGGSTYVMYVGDDNNFHDCDELIFNNRVSPFKVSSNDDYTYKIEFKTKNCDCGAKAVGVSDKELNRHSGWCDLNKGKFFF